MKNMEQIREQLANKVNGTITEAKQYMLAQRLYKEMEQSSAAQVLEQHLPAISKAKLDADAAKMQDAIRDAYEEMQDVPEREQLEARMSAAMADHSHTEQGHWLVNMLRYSAAVDPDSFDATENWDALQQAESFSEENVAELLGMASMCIDRNAAAMARREFQAMERVLDQLSFEVVEFQANSGARYAEAYAAAMYILNKQSDKPQPILAYQMGVMAVTHVESSRVLAAYSLGKIRAEVAFKHLKQITNAAIVTVILPLLANLIWVGSSLFLVAPISIATGILHPVLGVLVALLMSVWGVVEYSEFVESLTEALLDAYFTLKGIVAIIVASNKQVVSGQAVHNEAVSVSVNETETATGRIIYA